MKQMERGHSALMSKAAHTLPHHKNTRTGELELSDGAAKDGRVPPRLITLGGDHSITLPVLRSINKVYGPISVIVSPVYAEPWTILCRSGPTPFATTKLTPLKCIVMTSYSTSTVISTLGSPRSSAVPRRTRLLSTTVPTSTTLLRRDLSPTALVSTRESARLSADRATTRMTSEIVLRLARLATELTRSSIRDCGFVLSEAREIDTIGTEGIIEKIRNTVGDMPVYLSIDIDVLDPSAAPATGTPETGTFFKSTYGLGIGLARLQRLWQRLTFSF